MITGDRIEQEISEKTFTDEALAELDDLINEYIHNQREHEMIRLLKEHILKKSTMTRSDMKSINNTGKCLTS